MISLAQRAPSAAATNCDTDRRSANMPPAPPTLDSPGTSEAPASLGRQSLNAPNIITLSRLGLAIVLFLLIDINGWWRAATAVFVVAATTDFLDGYIARKYGLVTVLGRILDPFVDKIIICGVAGQRSDRLDHVHHPGPGDVHHQPSHVSRAAWTGLLRKMER